MSEPAPEEAAWIEQSQGLVRSLAYSLRRNLPEHVPVEDLIGYGQIGLLQAAKAYRAEYAASFQTFAYYRIRGAMLDGLGKMAWTTRAAQKRFAAERSSHEILNDPGNNGSSGDDSAVIETAEAAAGWLVRTTEKLAIVQWLTGTADGSGGDLAIVDRGERPDEQAARHELQKLLTTLVDRLPEVERSLVHLTYYEGKSLAEAARALGHSKSWASRLHSQILQRLARSANLLDVS